MESGEWRVESGVESGERKVESGKYKLLRLALNPI